MSEVAGFQKTDFVMLGILLFASMAIGVFFAVSGNRQSTKVEYLLGGRNMGAIPVCLSLFATFQSAIGLLGIPAEVYTYGTMVLYFNVGSALGQIVCIFTILPLVYHLNLTSVYEYLELRYDSKAIRLLGSIVGMGSSFSYMAIALLSPALALQTAVHIPLWISLIMVGGVGTIYTTVGGIRSVIWTDVFQTVIIFGGLIFVVVKGSMDADGIETVFEVSRKSGRIIFDEWSLDPRVRHTIWGLTIGGTAYWTSVNFSQSCVQRLCSTKSIKDSRKVLLLTIPMVLIYGTILLITGCVVMTYFFVMRCDPLAAGHITNRNQLMPYFIIMTLSFVPGLSGIYMSSLFSGALSTLSSGINSLAANTMEDLLMPFLKAKSEYAITIITKILVCLFGVAIIGTAYLIRSVSGPVTQVTFAALSATGGPVTGLFLLSATFPQANAFGAGLGTLASLAASVWISIGQIFYRKATPLPPSGCTDGCPSRNGTEALFWPQVNATTTALPYTLSSYTCSDRMESPSTLWATTDKSIISATDDTFSIYDISYPWMALLGMLLTVIVGLLLSLIGNAVMPKTARRAYLRPEFLFPFARRLWRLPASDLKDDLDFDLDTSF